MEFLGPVPRPSPDEWARMTPRDIAVTQLQQYAGHIRWRQANGATETEVAALLEGARAMADRIESGDYSHRRGFVSLAELLEIVSAEIVYNKRVRKATG